MKLRVTSALTVYPVSRAEAKAWCRIDDDITDQDAVVDLLIAALTDQAEHLTGRAFVQREYELLLDGFVTHDIVLPHPPLLSIDSVKYYDLNNTLQTIDPAAYEVDLYAEPGRLRPALYQTWPTTYTRFNAVQIAYTAGYAPGSPSSDAAYREAVPPLVKQWLQARISTLYEHREQLIRNGTVKIPRDFADGLLDSLVIGSRLF